MPRSRKAHELFDNSKYSYAWGPSGFEEYVSKEEVFGEILKRNFGICI